jgi:hypothetical protein
MPDQIDLIGDLVDFQSASLKFRDVPKDERATRLKFEINQARTFLRILRDTFPKANIQFYAGNHEQRLERYIRQHCPALYGLPELEVESLLGLPGLKIGYHPYGRLVAYGNFHVTHGDIVRKESAYTARAIFEKYGKPVMSGHTHRGGAYYKTMGKRVSAAWENFCTCKLHPPYLIGPPNWQHGFSVVHNDRKTRFHVSQVPIVDGRFVYEGTSYRRGSKYPKLVSEVKNARQ